MQNTKYKQQKAANKAGVIHNQAANTGLAPMTETQSNGAFDGPVIQVGNLDKTCVAQVHRHIHRWQHSSIAGDIVNSYFLTFHQFLTLLDRKFWNTDSEIQTSNLHLNAPLNTKEWFTNGWRSGKQTKAGSGRWNVTREDGS